jgi:hypothetical protein
MSCAAGPALGVRRSAVKWIVSAALDARTLHAVLAGVPTDSSCSNSL